MHLLNQWAAALEPAPTGEQDRQVSRADDAIIVDVTDAWTAPVVQENLDVLVVSVAVQIKVSAERLTAKRAARSPGRALPPLRGA